MASELEWHYLPELPEIHKSIFIATEDLENVTCGCLTHDYTIIIYSQRSWMAADYKNMYAWAYPPEKPPLTQI